MGLDEEAALVTDNIAAHLSWNCDRQDCGLEAYRKPSRKCLRKSFEITKRIHFDFTSTHPKPLAAPAFLVLTSARPRGVFRAPQGPDSAPDRAPALPQRALPNPLVGSISLINHIISLSFHFISYPSSPPPKLLGPSCPFPLVPHSIVQTLDPLA